jgi:hypothetical protein
MTGHLTLLCRLQVVVLGLFVASTFGLFWMSTSGVGRLLAAVGEGVPPSTACVLVALELVPLLMVAAWSWLAFRSLERSIGELARGGSS